MANELGRLNNAEVGAGVGLMKVGPFLVQNDGGPGPSSSLS